MRSFIFVLLFLAFHSAVDASQLPVVRLFSEITYETHVAGGFFSRDRTRGALGWFEHPPPRSEGDDAYLGSALRTSQMMRLVDARNDW